MAGTAPKKKSKDIKALLAEAKLPERSVALCLHPDLFARMQELERELQQAEDERKAATGSLASGSRSRELATEQAAVREQMLEHTVDFRFRALPRKKKRALETEFPPREGNAGDQLQGFNVDDVAEALVRRCLFDPVLDDDDWARLDESLSDGQWQLLANAAWAINASDVDVPFSRTASRILSSSAEE